MANTTVNPYVVARSTTRNTYPANADMPVGGLNAGEQLSANAVMTEVAAVAMGQTWQCSIATGSAFTHVAAWPTTRAEIVFKNNYGASSGIGMYIRSIWYANVATSIAAASNVTLLAQIVPSSATALTDDTAQLITSRSGKSGYGGSVTRAVANTSYAVASKWEVIGSVSSGGATATIGLGTSVPINGAFIVPPQALLCLNVVAGTAAGTASMGCVWDEMVIPLG